jgi:hypothetical protein
MVSADPRQLVLPLVAAGSGVPSALRIARSDRVFVNRDLRFSNIDWIGFDMDYTLALYNQRNLEELSIRCTLGKLVEKRGYPAAILDLEYDSTFAVRGIVVDRKHGNIFKMDRYGHVGRVYHGKRLLDKEERRQLYRTERIRLPQPRWAWIDTLFALPEAVMYATIIDYLESHGDKPQFSQLWGDIRECIDEAHRDETMKSIIKANLGEYFVRDADLAATLHKFRSSGKRLFLLTNSFWDYTNHLMSWLLLRLGLVDKSSTPANKPASRGETRALALVSRLTVSRPLCRAPRNRAAPRNHCRRLIRNWWLHVKPAIPLLVKEVPHREKITPR